MPLGRVKEAIRILGYAITIKIIWNVRVGNALYVYSFNACFILR